MICIWYIIYRVRAFYTEYKTLHTRYLTLLILYAKYFILFRMEQTQTTVASKILIVEDDLFLANLLSLRFKKEGFEVIQAFSGVEALKKLEEIRPSVVLLDIILPQKNGFEVLEAVAQNPQTSNIPVIIVSNLGQESDIEKGKTLGAMDYYVKARLSIDELVLKVSNLIASQSGV